MSANFAELMKNVKSSLSDLERTRWREDPSLPGQLGKALVKIEDLTAENVDCRLKLKKKTEELEEVKNQLEASEKSGEEHRRTIDRLLSDCDLWKSKYATNLDYMTVAHNNTMILEKKCAERDEQLKQLKSQETMTVEHNKAILSYKDAEVEELSIQLADAEKRVTSLNDSYTCLEKVSDEWAAFLKRKIRLTEEKLQAVEEKLKAAEEDLKDKTTDLADARAELGLQNNQLHDQTDEICKLKDEFEKMKEQMEEVYQEIQKLRKENERLEAENARLNAVLKVQRDMEDDFDVEGMQRGMKEVADELAECYKTGKTTFSKDLAYYLEACHTKQKPKNVELEELKKQLEASKKIEFDLREELKKVQRDNQACEFKVQMRSNTIRELKKQCAALKKGLKDEPKPEDLSLEALDFEGLKKYMSETVDEDFKEIDAKFVEEAHKQVETASSWKIRPEEPKVSGASEEPSTSQNWWHKDYVTDSSDNWEDCSSESHEDEEEEEEDGEESDAWSREANP
ncbi:unnamed protein product [Caenorhabditis brenneri]